jgi:hypothetical protein
MHFLDLRIKNYGCLNFLGEVWAGRACAGANEEELTNHKKIWGQEGGGKGQGVTKMEDPWGRGQWLPTAPQSAVADRWSVPLGDRMLSVPGMSKRTSYGKIYRPDVRGHLCASAFIPWTHFYPQMGFYHPCHPQTRHVRADASARTRIPPPMPPLLARSLRPSALPRIRTDA